MNTLELFAGSRSFWKVSEKLGNKNFSVEIEDYKNIDYKVDILKFDYNKIPFVPDIIWASPPCTSFSIAGCSTNRNLDTSPKTENGEKGDLLVLKTIDIIYFYLKINPRLKFYIENPTWILRNRFYMLYVWVRRTITYCSYGDTVMKPTDIWTNDMFMNWIPKTPCKRHKYDTNGKVINQKCHHEQARRWSKAGTQGKKWSYERSRIPKELFYDILKHKN